MQHLSFCKYYGMLNSATKKKNEDKRVFEFVKKHVYGKHLNLLACKHYINDASFAQIYDS